MTPRILIIAGPNGAGKTTFALEYLRSEGADLAFINADLIATGLNPTNPSAAAIPAGRLMLQEIERNVRALQSFAFETTLSGRAYARRISDWQAAGYIVQLIFLRLSSPDIAVQRVRRRVELGGHSIPTDVIVRRFHAGLCNLDQVYGNLVDHCVILDND